MLQSLFLTMKHGRGTRGAAPASDATRCSDTPRTLLPARPTVSRLVVPRGFHVFLVDLRRRVPMRLRLEPIRAESSRLGPELAVLA